MNRNILSSRRLYSVLLAGQAALVVSAAQVAESLVRIDCPIRTLVGLQCPGCGSTRCISAVGQGDFVAGAKHNPLLFTAIVGSAVLLAFGVLSPTILQSLVEKIQQRLTSVTVIAIATVVIFTVGRNLVS